MLTKWNFASVGLKWISHGIFVSWGKGKQKADKNRARVEENFLKLTHVQRQEAAQSRREEKKRAEKERIMNEEDPEKQRRLEVRETFYITGIETRFKRYLFVPY